MKEDFVTYDIAVKLKEKGFPQHICDDAYITENEYDDYEYLVGERWNIQFIPDYCIEVAAPQIHEVLKWLREKYATHIEISLGRNGWYFEIIQYEYYEEEKEYSCKLRTISVINDSYEETAIAGIEYVIDNLI